VRVAAQMACEHKQSLYLCGDNRFDLSFVTMHAESLSGLRIDMTQMSRECWASLRQVILRSSLPNIGQTSCFHEDCHMVGRQHLRSAAFVAMMQSTNFRDLNDSPQLQRLNRPVCRGRPHSSLGPGIPESVTSASISSEGRHQIPRGHRVIAKPVLGGLHHEYGLEEIAA
jgi:hypothetical protein